MNDARNFGEAQNTLTQLAYSAISLNYYNRDPANVDLLAAYRTNYERYALPPFANDTHPYASFGHLDGYSAIYYTYQWSQSIALDLFTRFEAEGLRNTDTARRYRELVLAPAGRSLPSN
ncbi:MAG: M3 family metallopeptidase [Terricaulis sp.]